MPAYGCKLFLRDAYARETTRSAIVAATDPVAAGLALSLWAADVQGVTKCHVYKQRFFIDEEIAGAPAAGANIDEGMTISVLLEGGVKKASIQLPAPVDDIRNADGTIDITNALMTALEENYQDKIFISDGEKTDHFTKARLDV
jgi:hypothetical protein